MTKAMAVLAFIVTSPGRTLFRTAMSKAQPTSTRQPTRMTINDEAHEKDFSEEMKTGLD